jgi:hypothetical protein
MRIRAKHKGVCDKCGKEILHRQWIHWEKGQGASHAHCPDTPWAIDIVSKTDFSNRLDRKLLISSNLADEFGRDEPWNAFHQRTMVEGEDLKEIEPGVWEARMPFKDKELVVRSYVQDGITTCRLAREYNPNPNWAILAFMRLIRLLKGRTGIPNLPDRIKLYGDSP